MNNKYYVMKEISKEEMRELNSRLVVEMNNDVCESIHTPTYKEEILIAIDFDKTSSIEIDFDA